MTEQLAFDLPRDPADLSDLQFTGHRARLDRLDGVDYSAPPAPACVCVPGPIPDAREAPCRCVRCGREVAE